MWKNMVQPDRPQLTIRCTRVACWITKATKTHSDQIILIAFAGQQWFTWTRLNVTLIRNLPAFKCYLRKGRRARLMNLWHQCQTWHPERFPWHVAFTAIPIFFISFARPASLYFEEHKHTYLTAYRLYMNYRCQQITLQWSIFTQIGAARSVDRIFISGAPVWRWLGAYMTLGRTFYSILLKQEAAAVQLLPNFLPYRIPRELY
jgi:hypothetical protein